MDVLIIDDDAASRMLLKRALRHMPPDSATCRFTEAATYDEALATIEQAFDVAFVDYRIPGVKGFELVAQLRTLHPELPIILFSGSRLPQIGVDGIAQGANAFIDKLLMTPQNVSRSIAEAQQSIRVYKDTRRYQEEIDKGRAKLKKLREDED